MTHGSSSGSAALNPEQGKQGTVGGAVYEVADQAKEAAGQVASQAQQAARTVAGQARQQVASQLGGQKNRAAEGLNSVVQALRQTSQTLGEQDQVGITHYIDRAAAQVEQFSAYLQRRDTGQLINDVERFARRQPALFLGGAFVLGVLGARFLKSSRQQLDSQNAYPLAQRETYSPVPDVYIQGYQPPSGAATGLYDGVPDIGTTAGAEERP